MTKEEERRRQQYPLTERVHAIEELAALYQRGRSWREIAKQWQMRPISGERDLLYDTWQAWERAGAPGDGERPSGYGPQFSAARSAWWKSRDVAVDIWLKGMVVEPDPLLAYHDRMSAARLGG